MGPSHHLRAPLSRVLMTALLMLMPVGAVLAVDPKPPDPADAELLEFLGSVDTGADAVAAPDDGSWIDYLSQTDIGKVAKAGDSNGAHAKQAAVSVPPGTGDKKHD